jgi:hypothetical protein
MGVLNADDQARAYDVFCSFHNRHSPLTTLITANQAGMYIAVDGDVGSGCRRYYH